VRSASDFELTFNAMTDDPPSAIVTFADGTLLVNKVRIIEFAAKIDCQQSFPTKNSAEAGGLMTYGPSLSSTFRRAVDYMDRILKGANPGDLPIEQATQFRLVINLKTAKTLSLAIPR
jgi:putative ABC transport system substrate-binding protein